jgi:anaerobic glycerol-3-phosphate dehydrogenase
MDKSVNPFDETVEHELVRALDNYADDPDENGALNRLVNNCVTIGYEFADRAHPTLDLGEDKLVERLLAASKGFIQATHRGYYGICEQAADRITTLHAEREKLLAENARLREKRRLKIVSADPIVFEEDAALGGIMVEPKQS